MGTALTIFPGSGMVAMVAHLLWKIQSTQAWSQWLTGTVHGHAWGCHPPTLQGHSPSQSLLSQALGIGMEV